MHPTPVMGEKRGLSIEVVRTVLQIYKTKWAKYFEEHESYKYIPILPKTNLTRKEWHVCMYG